MKHTLLITSLLCILLCSSFRLQHEESLNKYVVKTIVIDAGHGGHDSGCLGSYAKEKDVTLAVALKTGALIEKNYPHIKVIYTRKTDEFIELYERAAIANRNNADLFISFHCNANKATAANGTETWVMGLHKTGGNLDVAKRENAVVLMEENYAQNYEGFDPNSPEATIMLSLNQNAHMSQSILLASVVEDEFKRDGRAIRGVKQAGFLVLWKTTMPSILIEMGFLTNRTEEKYLTSTSGQNEIASSVFSAVKNFKAHLENEKEEKNSDDHEIQNETHQSHSSQPDDTLQNSQEIKFDRDSVRSNVIFPARDEIIYKVQIMASPKIIDTKSGKLGQIHDIQTERSTNGVYRYLVGYYLSTELANSRLKKMQSIGFKDAFIVAYQNGKRIAMQTARQ